MTSISGNSSSATCTDSCGCTRGVWGSALSRSRHSSSTKGSSPRPSRAEMKKTRRPCPRALQCALHQQNAYNHPSAGTRGQPHRTTCARVSGRDRCGFFGRLAPLPRTSGGQPPDRSANSTAAEPAAPGTGPCPAAARLLKITTIVQKTNTEREEAVRPLPSIGA